MFYLQGEKVTHNLYDLIQRDHEQHQRDQAYDTMDLMSEYGTKPLKLGMTLTEEQKVVLAEVLVLLFIILYKFQFHVN